MSLRVLWLIKGLGPGRCRGVARYRGRVRIRRRHRRRVRLRAAAEGPPRRTARACRRVAATASPPTGFDWKWPLRLRQLLVHGNATTSSMLIRRCRLRLAASSRRPSGTAPGTREHRAQRLGHLRTADASGPTASPAASTTPSSPSATRHGQACRSDNVPDARARSRNRSRASVEPAVGSIRACVAELGHRRFDVRGRHRRQLPEQKDYPNLLSAAAAVGASSGADVCVVAVGQGPLEQEILELRDRLGLTDVVRLSGLPPRCRAGHGRVRRLHAVISAGKACPWH